MLQSTLTTLTPNQCSEYGQTVYSAVKQADGTYSVQTLTVKDGKVTACTQALGYANAAAAKTAINLLTAAWIDSL